MNKWQITRNGQVCVPAHLSKDQDIAISAGDVICVSTPGGGGFGESAQRSPASVQRDLALGYYTQAQATHDYHQGAASP